ncbi:MAG TPA: winged helix-turn-helix domain-containing protein [Stellaceae bacterium]|nr:winged helix-turn-helix domain-containing protein [Stellaceae bacterium]
MQDQQPIGEVDLGRRELRLRGAPVVIGSRAFEIAEVLVRAAGDLVGKDALMGRVWPGAFVEENTLQVHISALRKALGQDRAMLQTVSGRGYRLLGTWRVTTGEDAARRTSTAVPEAPVPGVRDNLPVATADLIGRTEAMRHLQNLLSAYRGVTVVGPGGIGKTALALEVARRVLAGFEGDCRIVELAPLADPNLVPSAAAGALGIRAAGGEITVDAIARALGSKTVLLLLDNCEHVVDAAASLAEALINHCPNTTVLATSREALRIDGEYVYRVPPLDVPMTDDEPPDDLRGLSSVQLFVARITALASDFAATPEDLRTIAAICRHLDGIPLAIEFAAARAATLGLSQVAALLGDRFRLLTGGRRTALPRHRTLRATLDWSYNLLPEDEAAVLRRSAVFVGDFSLDAATAVAGDLPASGVVEGIANLVAKSLVAADLRAETAHYRLLETTRLFALEKLRDNDEHRQAALRHALYYRDLFAPAEAESETRRQSDWLAIYGRHIDNVRAALDWAFLPDGDPQLGVALTVAAVPLWVQLSLLGECRDRVERALATIELDAAASERARMQLSAALAWSMTYGAGRASEAAPILATTLEIAEKLDDRGYKLRALWGLCIDQFNNGQFRTALDFARRFAGLVSNSSDAVELMLGDRLLAIALHYLGDQNGARHYIDRVLAQLEALAHHPQIVRLRFDHRESAHYFQARILWLQGYADQALRVVKRNVEEGQAIGHALTFCSVLGQGACPVAFLCGDLDAAAGYGAMLLDHTERHPIRLWRLWACCFNGIVIARRGDLASGLAALRGGLEDAGEARFLPRFLLLVGELAALLGEAGEVAQALATVDEALSRCQTRDEGWYVAELLRIKGELLLTERGRGGAAKADELFLSALARAREQGARAWELRAATSLARSALRQGRPEQAKHILAPVFAWFTEGFETADLRSARALLAAS